MTLPHHLANNACSNSALGMLASTTLSITAQYQSRINEKSRGSNGKR